MPKLAKVTKSSPIIISCFKNHTYLDQRYLYGCIEDVGIHELHVNDIIQANKSECEFGVLLMFVPSLGHNSATIH